MPGVLEAERRRTHLGRSTTFCPVRVCGKEDRCPSGGSAHTWHSRQAGGSTGMRSRAERDLLMRGKVWKWWRASSAIMRVCP